MNTPTTGDDGTIAPMFFDIAKSEVQRWGGEFLQNIPEARCLAVVVSWRPPLENIPSGFIVGGEGTPVALPSDIVRLHQQVLVLQEHLIRKQAELLSHVDQLMLAAAERLKSESTAQPSVS